MNMDFNKLPKFVYILLVTIIVAVLYWIFIGQSLIKNAPELLKQHEDNVVLISKYDKALEQEQTIETEIKKNTQEYERKQKELFIDLDTCSKEIEQYFKEKNIKLKNYSISEPTQDSLSRVSSGGFPVYTVNISLLFNSTYDQALDFLKYFEKTSKGCYNIGSFSFQPGKNSNSGEAVASMTLYYYDTSSMETTTEPETETSTETTTETSTETSTK